MRQEKTLKDLNLLDRFLFAEAADDPEFVELLLEIILGKDIALKHLPQTEKENRKSLWSKHIKLDVWAMDTDDAIYDTEVQNRNTGNLPKRTRFYHDLIGSKLLPPGTVDYSKLNDVFVIMIMPFDLFGEGAYQYTFRMSCREFPGLELNDGVTTIFLNTKGTNTNGVSDELIALLKYFEDTRPETAAKSESKRILKMQEKVEAIRANEEIGVKLMNAWEEKIYDREDGRQEGLQEGLRQGMEKGLQAGIEKGLQQGIEKGLQAGLEKGLQQGFTDAQEQLIIKMKRTLSDEEIANLTDIPLETVKAIS